MLKIAHRGASLEAPENTLSAIRLALQYDIHLVEIDVRLTQDLVPILHHDSHLSRTTRSKCESSIEDLTLNEVKELDVGSWFNSNFKDEKVPTLEEVLRLNFRQKGLMVEIKEGKIAPEIAVDKILEACRKANFSPIIKGSFGLEIVRRLLAVEKRDHVVGIVEKPELLPFFLNEDLKKMAIWYPLIHPFLISELHERGCEVWAFTVDDPKKIRFLQAIDVDGIITNNPDQVFPG